MRPPQARRDKPGRAYFWCQVEEILELKLIWRSAPASEDEQLRRVDTARRGSVDCQPSQRGRHSRLHRSRRVGGRGCARPYADELQRGLDAIAAQVPQRPRVYVEEWDEPIIWHQWGAEPHAAHPEEAEANQDALKRAVLTLWLERACCAPPSCR